MTPKPVLAIAAAAAALTLAACADVDESTAGPGGIEVSDPATQSSASPPASSATQSPSTTGSSGSEDDDDLNDVEVSDQSGDGSSVLVERVRVEVPGFVVIVVDEDGAVVGSAPVDAGETSQLSVPATITQSGDYEAQLYADDGNGEFDPATDVPVRNADDDDDDDDDDGGTDDDADDDVESDDFGYEVG